MLRKTLDLVSRGLICRNRMERGWLTRCGLCSIVESGSLERECEQVRLEKFLSSSRMYSRREAKKLIEQGRVQVNGTFVQETVRVGDMDIVRVDGKKVSITFAKNLEDSVFLCHKLRGELVTRHDPAGRPTLFERLERMGLPNLISIGRLDRESEGLILLTTSGEFARYMELPENKIIRKYRVRIVRGVFNGKIQAKLADGLRISKSTTLRPMMATMRFEQHKKAAEKRKEQKRKIRNKKDSSPVEPVNYQWLDVHITEGKYREIRQSLAKFGLIVDRLIRIEYGPYALGNLPKGNVLKVKRRDLLANSESNDASDFPRVLHHTVAS